ncbi:MAG: antitoxin [bacterium]
MSPKSFIVDQKGKIESVVLDYNTYRKMEELILDYGLARSMEEIADEEEIDIEEAKKIAGFDGNKV